MSRGAAWTSSTITRSLARVTSPPGRTTRVLGPRLRPGARHAVGRARATVNAVAVNRRSGVMALRSRKRRAHAVRRQDPPAARAPSQPGARQHRRSRVPRRRPTPPRRVLGRHRRVGPLPRRPGSRPCATSSDGTSPRKSHASTSTATPRTPPPARESDRRPAVIDLQPDPATVRTCSRWWNPRWSSGSRDARRSTSSSGTSWRSGGSATGCCSTIPRSPVATSSCEPSAAG